MSKTKDEDVAYLGDGVYAAWDGYGIELRANDHRNPTDTIYVEPGVFTALTRFFERMTAKAEEPTAKQGGKE